MMLPQSIETEYLMAETVHQDMIDRRVVLLKFKPGIKQNLPKQLETLREWLTKLLKEELP